MKFDWISPSLAGWNGAAVVEGEAETEQQNRVAKQTRRTKEALHLLVVGVERHGRPALKFEQIVVPPDGKDYFTGITADSSLQIKGPTRPKSSDA